MRLKRQRRTVNENRRFVGKERGELKCNLHKSVHRQTRQGARVVVTIRKASREAEDVWKEDTNDGPICGSTNAPFTLSTGN